MAVGGGNYLGITLIPLRVWCTGLMEVAMIYGKNIDQAGIEDRAYRLHYNESQNRTDTFARVRLPVTPAASARNWLLS